jgi:hypothetical protein
MQHQINPAQSAERTGEKMNRTIPPEVDINNIRSKSQLEATLSGIEAAKVSGCASWCNREGQKSPVVFESELVEVRHEHEDFKKPGADRWFVIVKRHASLMELTPEEMIEVFQARQRVVEEYDLKGCSINRIGSKEYTASSLQDNHYYEIMVKTTPGIPYKETLVKDLTGENLTRLEERAKEITS